MPNKDGSSRDSGSRVNPDSASGHAGRQLILDLAAEAVTLSDGLEWPNNIFEALDRRGIADPPTRRRLGRAVARELGMRGGLSRRRRRPRRFHSPYFSDAQMEMMIRDAAIRELGHPKDD